MALPSYFIVNLDTAEVTSTNDAEVVQPFANSGDYVVITPASGHYTNGDAANFGVIESRDTDTEDEEDHSGREHLEGEDS